MRCATLLMLVIGLSGCVHSIGSDIRADQLDRNQGYVLVGSLGVYQIGVCHAWNCFPGKTDYVMGDENGVNAFPVKVGTMFILATASVGPGWHADINGPALVIERPGVYVYGTVARVSGNHIRLTPGGDPRLIAKAAIKYRDSLATLPAINFQWPKPTTPPPEYPAPAASAPEKWQLKPLVLIGSEAPQTGGRFEELGRPQWLESGYLFFWGRYGKKDSDSGFFSLKDGRVSAAALGKGYGRNTAWFAGKSKVFLAQATSFTGLVSPRFPRVWDGERLTTVLTERDEIELGGVRYQAWYGQVTAVSGDEARIDYFTKQPRKTSVVALYDGKGVSPLFAIGEPLPAAPGFRVEGVGSLAFASASGSYFAVLGISGAPYKGALFRLTRETATLILAIGEKDPLEPTKTIVSIDEIEADRSDRVAVHATRGGEGKTDQVVYFWVDGRLRRVFAAAGGHSSGMFLSPEMPHYFLRVVETNAARHMVTSVSFLLFDGERLTNLTSDIWSEKEPVPLEEVPKVLPTNLVTGDFNGLLIRWAKRVANSTGPFFEPAWWFLDITAKPLRFRPAPEFTTVDGRRVMLADVLAWVRPGAALVQLPEGYFLLSKQQSN